MFLLAGIGGILNVVGMRLNRSIDRTRVLEEQNANGAGNAGHGYVDELKLLERRIKHSNFATTLSVASALSVCLVVMLLFVSTIFATNLGNAIAITSIIAMVLLAGGLIEFLTEIHIAVGGRRLHRQHLRHQNDHGQSRLDDKDKQTASKETRLAVKGARVTTALAPIAAKAACK